MKMSVESVKWLDVTYMLPISTKVRHAVQAAFAKRMPRAYPVSAPFTSKKVESRPAPGWLDVRRRLRDRAARGRRSTTVGVFCEYQ